MSPPAFSMMPEARRACFLNPADQLALMIRLAKIHRQPKRLSPGLGGLAHVIQGLAPVDLGLADTQEIEVGSVEDENRLGHISGLSALMQGLTGCVGALFRRFGMKNDHEDGPFDAIREGPPTISVAAFRPRG